MKLSVWQRAMLVLIVGDVSGTVAVMRKANKALDVLEFSKVEKEKVGLAILPDGTLRWNNDQDTDEIRYNILIRDKETMALVRRLFTAFDKWQGRDSEKVLDLEKQLGIKEEKDDQGKSILE